PAVAHRAAGGGWRQRRRDLPGRRRYQAAVAARRFNVGERLEMGPPGSGVRLSKWAISILGPLPGQPARAARSRAWRSPVLVGAGWQDAAMRYSVNAPNLGEFAAPEVFAEVARRAEQAGWDAVLVWDHVAGEKDLRWEIADPWILLTAAALAT